MNRMSRTRGLLVWTAVPLALLILMGVAAERSPALALINESPSLPVGLYMRQTHAPPVRGSVVAIGQPASTQAYLASLGMPGEVRLIKRVAATGGDPVCWADGMVHTPTRSAPVLRRDRRNVALPSWRGCRTLAADELFLLGDTPSSYDSRYFGPVRRAQIQGVYKETLTW